MLLLRTSADVGGEETQSYYGDVEAVSVLNTPLHHSAGRQVSINDFDILKRISKGAYGRVFLAKKKTTGDLFAIKVCASKIRKKMPLPTF